MTARRDPELEKIQGLMNRLDDFQNFFYRGKGWNFTPRERNRIKKYLRERYSWFFEWINSDE